MPTALIVDDSEGDREIARRLLEQDTALSVVCVDDGAQALQFIDDAAPDVIVTDLRMPKVDGLAVVERVRRQLPGVPVVLMTAHGSESIAMEALQRGAASYVPKVQLAERLLSTVLEVLALSQAARSHQRLIDCLTRTEFEFQLDNDPELIPALVDLVQQMVAGVQLCDANGRVRIAVALEEALLNALYHGNLEISREQMRSDTAGNGSLPSLADLRRNQPPYRDRKIHLAADITTNRARFVIRDEGPGFNLAEIPDPDNPENVERANGRGLLLIQTFMDDVQFNEAGNEVVMEMQVLKPPETTAPESPPPPGTALFRHSTRGDALVITPLRGISSFAEEAVQQEMSTLLKRIETGDVRALVVDFSRLEYFGSNMLEALRILWKQLRPRQGKLVVCGLSTVGREIIHLARFDTLFPVVETLDDALARVHHGS